MVPYATKAMLVLTTNLNQHVVYIDAGKVSKVELVNPDQMLELEATKEYNLFTIERPDTSLLQTLEVGADASIDFKFYVPLNGQHSQEDDSQDAKWKGMDYVLTGNPFLVKDGLPNPNAKINDSSMRRIASMVTGTPARSALCYQEDGSWLLITLQNASTELMCTSLARIGCKHAINLDGGPSARIRLRDGTSSDSSDRHISDALLFFPKTANVLK